MNENLQHLKLLSIFHYIVGGLAGLFACLPIFHLVIGIALIIASSAAKGNGDLPPAIVGWLFALLGFAIIIMGWTFAICVICAGRCLARRKHYIYCLIIAGIECTFLPYGTVLGVFTIIVLMKPEVKELFNGSTSYGQAGEPQGGSHTAQLNRSSHH